MVRKGVWTLRLGKQKIIVLFAWGLVFVVSLLALLNGWSFVLAAYPFRWWLLFTFFVATATALALGLKNIFLTLPGFLFPLFAVVMAFAIGKFGDMRPLLLSVLFFLFFTTCGPLLIRSFKDEKMRDKVYQGALLIMVFFGVIFLLSA